MKRHARREQRKRFRLYTTASLVAVAALVGATIACKLVPDRPSHLVAKSTGCGSGTCGYHVVGRYVYDPCGQKLLVRGVESVAWNSTTAPIGYEDPKFVAQVAETGANTLRILPYESPEWSGQPKPVIGMSYQSVSQVKTEITNILSAGLVADIGLAGGTVTYTSKGDPVIPSAYTDPAWKAMLQAPAIEDHLLIHALGEGTQTSSAQWVADAKSVVAQFRAAGYTAPLYILPDTYGRDLPAVLKYGASIEASDPLHNVVFGWQAYWGVSYSNKSITNPMTDTTSYYQHLYHMSLDQAMQDVATAPFPIQIGLTYYSDPTIDPTEIVPYVQLMTLAQQDGIGWLWWDWSLDNESLVWAGQYGYWATNNTTPDGKTYAQEVVVNAPDSLRNTGKTDHTTYISTGHCA
jgi:mannan endo-1,4-beta-mannosidase